MNGYTMPSKQFGSHIEKIPFADDHSNQSEISAFALEMI